MGGGMGSSMFGEGIQGQECSNIGPQFNMQGDCIACCGEEYAGEGFYGTGEEFEYGTGTVDPDANTDCVDMYNETGGMSGLSYEEFAATFCP
jgi:hypothetical protein